MVQYWTVWLYLSPKLSPNWPIYSTSYQRTTTCQLEVVFITERYTSAALLHITPPAQFTPRSILFSPTVVQHGVKHIRTVLGYVFTMGCRRVFMVVYMLSESRHPWEEPFNEQRLKKEIKVNNAAEREQLQQPNVLSIMFLSCHKFISEWIFIKYFCFHWNFIFLSEVYFPHLFMCWMFLHTLAPHDLICETRSVGKKQ